MKYNESCQGYDYDIGDEVWYVCDGGLIAIKGVVRTVYGWARIEHPSGFLFYDLDFPHFNEIHTLSLFPTRSDAEAYLQAELDGLKEEGENVEEHLTTYEDYIRGLNLESYEEKDILEAIAEKKETEGWFNLSHLPLRRENRIYQCRNRGQGQILVVAPTPEAAAEFCAATGFVKSPKNVSYEDYTEEYIEFYSSKGFVIPEEVGQLGMRWESRWFVIDRDGKRNDT